MTRDRTLNGANIPLLVRDHIANDEKSLCREFFGVGHVPSLSVPYLMRNHLEELERAGLIHGDVFGHYEVSPQWPHVQNALGLSLTQCARF
jgi:hypothetical protein